MDTSFNPGSGFNSTVQQLLIQTDGKIIVVGAFTNFNGEVNNRIVRLNPNGSLDTSFNPGTGANNSILSLAVQPDGKILIVGFFTSYNGTSRNYIARLNADGSIENTFNPGTGANSFIYSISLQSDGRLIVGGIFSSFNGVTRNGVARLNSDGSLDSNFNIGTGVNGSIFYTSVALNDKIIIGGSFFSFNSVSRNNFARLNSDGSLDTSFQTGSGLDGQVRTSILLSDDKLFIGGTFFSYNNIQRGYFAKVDEDGGLDSNFNPVTGANNSINAIAIQEDRKILIGGDFTSYGGVNSNRIARLNENGSIDMSFVSGLGFNATIASILIQPDGKILVGGSFTNYNYCRPRTI